MKKKYNVFGMTCSACSSHVEKAVSGLSGVTKVNVNLLQNSMTVEYDENMLGSDEIIQAVEKGGYGASPAEKQIGIITADETAQNGIAEDSFAVKKRLINQNAKFNIFMYFSRVKYFSAK